MRAVSNLRVLGLENPSAKDLRNLDAQDVIDAVTYEIADGFHHVRDGVVFPKNVGIAFQDGDYYTVPTLFGYNSDESTVFFPDDPNPTIWTKEVPVTGRAAQINALKPHFGLASERLVDLYGLDESK